MADGGRVIDNLTIQNFRLFESLEVKGIKQVNLIVGRNNAGKSALLEAFQLYFSQFSIVVILRILQARQEIVNNKISLDGHFSSIVLRHIFKNHDFPLDDIADNIKIYSNGAYSYEMGLMQIKGQGYESVAINDIKKNRNFEDVNIVINASYDNKNMSSNSFPIDSILDDKFIKQDSFWSIFRGKFIEIKYVSTQGLLDKEALYLWDSISLTSAQDDVIKAFYIIEPNITGLSFVAADNESNNRIPIVKLKDMSEPIPLKSLGDGMTRLFHIILSLVTAKDGVLLIDEFENGLHWSTQTKAWELIFILAKQWNVQVFCTTHSKDCINSFEGIWTQNPEDAAFFRLYRKENQSHIKAYDLEMLSDAIETETEVR
jgi:AAA15 family ATPase/GTPase